MSSSPTLQLFFPPEVGEVGEVGEDGKGGARPVKAALQSTYAAVKG